MTIQARFLRNSVFIEPAAAEYSAADDVHAFVRLYDEYFPRVYNYVRYRCGDASTADDLTAQTFERALDRWKQYDPQRAPFGAWLFAIARSVVNNYLRAETRRDWLPLDVCDQQPDRAVTPEESLIQVETQAELLAALVLLSDRDRDLISLKFAARLTNRRIGQITGLSEANVAVILYRALHRLRIVLDKGQTGDA